MSFPAPELVKRAPEIVFCGTIVTWEFLLRLVLVRGWLPLARWLGHADVPRRDDGVPGRFRLPVTWVFSLYVVQAGSACR
jgi:hypothetical protein